MNDMIIIDLKKTMTNLQNILSEFEDRDDTKRTALHYLRAIESEVEELKSAFNVGTHELKVKELADVFQNLIMLASKVGVPIEQLAFINQVKMQCRLDILKKLEITFPELDNATRYTLMKTVYHHEEQNSIPNQGWDFV